MESQKKNNFSKIFFLKKILKKDKTFYQHCCSITCIFVRMLAIDFIFLFYESVFFKSSTDEMSYFT